MRKFLKNNWKLVYAIVATLILMVILSILIGNIQIVFTAFGISILVISIGLALGTWDKERNP